MFTSYFPLATSSQGLAGPVGEVRPDFGMRNMVGAAKFGSAVHCQIGSADGTHGAAGTAHVHCQIGSGQGNANGKANQMTATTQEAGKVNASNVTLNPVKVYSDEQEVSFRAADAAANLAANGAPIAFVAALLVADNYASGVILEPRGKDPVRVARLAKAKEAFGNERTPFRFWATALAYRIKASTDVETAVSMATKDDKGKPIKTVEAQVARATGLLVRMMASRGYHTMHGLSIGLGLSKDPADGKGKGKGKADNSPKSGEGEGAADGGKVKVADAAADVRTALICEALKAGGFSPEQHALIAAAVLAAKPADVTADAEPEKVAA